MCPAPPVHGTLRTITTVTHEFDKAALAQQRSDRALEADRRLRQLFAAAVPSARLVEIEANHFTITTHDDSIAAIDAFLGTS